MSDFTVDRLQDWEENLSPVGSPDAAFGLNGGPDDRTEWGLAADKTNGVDLGAAVAGETVGFTRISPASVTAASIQASRPVLAGVDTIPGDISTTVTIGVGGSLTSELDSAGDRDWIAVTLQAGRTYSISLSGSGANAVSDTYLRLMNAAGIQVAFDDDGGAGTNSLLVFTATTTGTYYINAGAYDDALTGEYTVEVNAVKPPSFLDSIDWGTQVSTNVIQVYFAPRGTTYDGVTSLGWNAYEIQQAMLGFQQFENIANVTITRTTNAAVELKVLIDQVREQVQNIE